MNPPYVLDRSPRERVHYFSRQLITAEDMIDEQTFFLEKLRRHNRFLHGWGVVCGCAVDAAPTSQYPWRVKISAGYLLDPIGNEIWLSDSYFFDLATHLPTSGDPCTPAGSRPAAVVTESGSDVFLALCFDECDSRPVRVHPAGCGCDEAGCEYSRVRDSFCFRVRSEIPDYQQKAQDADAKWLAAYKAWANAGRSGPPPAAGCPDSPADPCVVLAKITLPLATAPLGESSIDNNARRVLHSAHVLEILTQI